ncbi:MAG TPA: SgcJ/EcaC family oxidoreductase, partial [Candidatus Sulfotelmatobacter sp.]|nr:SgcJ/EcaC family oxidoreductase [Candidatus Sulfotelmatobacter sp.]
QKLFVDFNNALNNHDAHGAAMLFTEDGDFIGVKGKIIHGRADIEAQLAPLFDGILKNMHRDATLRGMRFLRPDVATVYSDYVTTGVVGANGAAAPATKGMYDWVVTKQDGRWLIAVWREANL